MYNLATRLRSPWTNDELGDDIVSSSAKDGEHVAPSANSAVAATGKSRVTRPPLHRVRRGGGTPHWGTTSSTDLGWAMRPRFTLRTMLRKDRSHDQRPPRDSIALRTLCLPSFSRRRTAPLQATDFQVLTSAPTWTRTRDPRIMREH
jgi:hypothetical protein